ncbi:hypothetical protein FKV75_03810 [Weissella paramesenteroides]|uniref:YopX family protein n=2 Tax=Weissella paramesenteroides TaxID=1249 RepID=UPI00123C3B4E|nr:hypothetical protein FKV77_08195 [Weissella paramesenteroides]KAA8440963.1 hypothetical protein FKV81_04785 [Weissella paramesenteroides]KAA8443394.1 hypothetical protein FKV75_03810 [Weissella paramesenteroides]KAA8447683.1 hypothetical protein FKV76_04030 [Weissella paramesenteroides]KAA8449714.1 hypothetical protein FKV74_05885 [Weissella paramesenteroides]
MTHGKSQLKRLRIMKNLKFRVWNEMYHCYFSTENGGEYALEETGSLIESDDYHYFDDVPDNQGCVVEQWTGLKDMNDIDIYEGDIVKILRTGTRKSIGFDEITFLEARFCFKHEDIRDNYLPFLSHSDIYSLKIIGNIHENNELVEKIGVPG